MKRSAIIFLFILFYNLSYSQEFTVNGMVKDAKTDNPIIGAAVFELGDAVIGTATDTEGFFSLRFSKKHILLKVAYIGYQDTVFDISLQNDTAIIVNLISQTDIDEVEIEDDSINWKPDENKISGNYKKIIAEGADLKNTFVPKMFFIPRNKKSEKIPVQDLFISENNGLYGKLMFIDGARIYKPGSRSDIFSFINKDAIEDYEYYSTDFPAEYGGHLAPVLDIAVKKGNFETYSGTANINFIGTTLSAEGPILTDKSSFFVSGRKTYFNNSYTDIFRKDNSLKEEYWSQPAFWDINLKYVHKLSKNNEFFVSFFHNSDNLASGISETINDSVSRATNREINSTYGNTASTIHFKHIFSKNFIFNSALIFSRYNLKQSFTGDSLSTITGVSSYINRYNADYTSGNDDIALKSDVAYNTSAGHRLLFGINATNHHFRPISATLSLNDFEHPNNIDTSWSAPDINTQEYILFASDKFNVNDLLFIDGGIRFSAFVNNGSNYFSVEPRLFADYKLFKFLSLNIAYAYHKEYIHLLSGNSTGLTSDIFIPSSQNILPQVTNHFAAGAKIKLPFDIKLEGTVFYDNISDMYDYKDNFNYFDYPDEIILTGMNTEERIIPVKGNYTGIRTTLSKKYEHFSINIGHTISDFSLNSDSINFGQSYAYQYNRRHDFNLKLTYSVNENLTVFANWVYRSGNFVTLQKQHYIPYEYNNGRLGTGNLPDASTVYLTDYTETPPFGRNDFKLPAYHRLDIGANYVLDNHTFGIHIYNVYNQKNTDFTDYKRSVLTNSPTNQLVKYTNLPFFPTISYTFRFNK